VAHGCTVYQSLAIAPTVGIKFTPEIASTGPQP
jgi:hypothetical protein